MCEFDEPLVCICIPTYNSAQTIRETLNSIINQSYKNLKIKIVDNNSTDDTIEIITSIMNDRVELNLSSENIGAEGNFNRCIKLGEGKYTAIFHADDIYESEMIAKQVAFLEKQQDAGGVFTEANLIDVNGCFVGVIHQPKDIAKKGPLFSFDVMYKGILKHSNFLICPSFMARTNVYKEEIKAWRSEMFGSSADLDVWLRVLQKYNCGILAEPLMRYRISTSQFSQLVREGVERADFFRVIDYYQSQTWVTKNLNRIDFLNYSRLERRDRFMRAANNLLMGNKVQAYELCADVFSLDSFCASFLSKRGAMVFLLGVFIRLSISLGLTQEASKVLFYLKNKLVK